MAVSYTHLMKELLCRLGNPQDDLSFIHISGTNGKGSVLAYLSTILSNAGYRTGRYISPTLFSYRERIQVDGEKIEKESLAKHVTAIALAIENMKKEHLGSPTAFEVETALSFLYFKEKQCDIVVLETGLGGALDATNIIKTTVLEVIASIGMDHMEFLGNTLEAVSYTHLDVYKRQAWSKSRMAISYCCANSFFCSDTSSMIWDAVASISASLLIMSSIGFPPSFFIHCLSYTFFIKNP